MSSQTQPCWDELPKVDLQEGKISIASLNNSFSKFVARMLHLQEEIAFFDINTLKRQGETGILNISRFHYLQHFITNHNISIF